MSKAAVKAKKGEAPAALVFEIDPTECPFREFRDSELGSDLWGLGPAATRATLAMLGRGAPKNADTVWVDDQTQPLPRSVRVNLNGWVRAEEVAYDIWEDDVEVFDEDPQPFYLHQDGGGLMSLIEYQTSHTSVLTRSSFCRRVMSICFMLERAEGLVLAEQIRGIHTNTMQRLGLETLIHRQFFLKVEHQWENFSCTMAPDGWRAKYHIYSPGLKSGGGPAHRPTISKNGCYLVRLFYLGAWRCVWVSDQVPVDSNDSPLLPFAPLLTHTPSKPGTKAPATTIISSDVYLWPLLLCKALLKLAAPDMSSDEDLPGDEDEPLQNFDILHALTGCMNMKYHFKDPEKLWQMLKSEIPTFTWDDDDETNASTVKSRAAKKSSNKDAPAIRVVSMATIEMVETKNEAAYSLPGITPAYEMSLIVTMVRDLPLKKPLPEPEVALWKYYRWVDWAKAHGMYEPYDCPRIRFLKANGLMKLSYAPHLLDVMSTESITVGFREEQDKTGGGGGGKKNTKDAALKNQQTSATNQLAFKEEMKQWVQFNLIQKFIKLSTLLYFPSVFEFTSAGDAPPTRVTRSTPNRAIDIVIPKTAPLYLQIDGPEPISLRMSLAMLHPRVMFNCGIPIAEYMEPAYVLVEEFDWFEGNEIPLAKAYLETREYQCLEMTFPQGRHYCRIWVHSRMNCHIMMLSESSILLGTRDLILEAASHECPWSARFLSNLGSAFTNWIRVSRSTSVMMSVAGDRDFYMSYAPDLKWDPEVVGYNKSLLHWMFRQALQSYLAKKLSPTEFESVCVVLRRHFLDPDFGFPPKPLPGRSLREVVANEPCDCLMPEVEEIDLNEELLDEHEIKEDKPLVSQSMMDRLLTAPVDPDISQICELATEELPCGLLKEEREKFLMRHDAATYLQAHWRGVWARKCLRGHILIPPEVIKMIMENSFGSLETLSALMNEFFHLFPGTKSAFSVASALTGSYSLTQHSGISHVTPVCKWIPYFQVVYYCHGPVKVHFDIQSSLPQSSYMVFDNDTGEQLPQTYNAHLTFDFKINNSGYTVFAHGTLNKASGHAMDAQWQFTVLTSVGGFFHICDNDVNLAGTGCNELQMVPAYKLHINEIFLPNRRNVVGGILISVTKQEAVSFRAAATSPDLDMVATLCSIQNDDEYKEIAHCSGTGEIYWPFISLKPMSPWAMNANTRKKSASHANLYNKDSQGFSARSLKLTKPKPLSAGKCKSMMRIKDRPQPIEPKTYSIQVTVRNGWPLTLVQWNRVDEIRNSMETAKTEIPTKKQSKHEKGKGAAIVSKVTAPPPPKADPLPGDAFVELECSLTTNGGAYARRDDLRDVELHAAVRSWSATEPGRNLKGAAIRQEFRLEFLETPAAPPSIHESILSLPEETFEEEDFGDETKKDQQLPQGPTPATESEMLEMEAESEEEAKFLSMPDQLKDKFIPLQFLPLCMRDQLEHHSVVMSPDMAEAARQDRNARIEASKERMRELQEFNERHVLGQQVKRMHLLQQLFVDSQWPPNLAAVLEERDEAIVREVLTRQLSAQKKKLDAKVQSKK